MMLVTSEEMAAIDSRAQADFAIPGSVLMESAGMAAWQYLRSVWAGDGSGRSIVFVVGHGNNGGDALVMARYCAAEGNDLPLIVLAKDSLKGDAELQRGITAAMDIPRLVWTSDRTRAEAAILGADLIVDGLAGTGLAGPLRSPLSDIARSVNESEAIVASIDCPSGVGDGISPVGGGPFDTVRSDMTLTLGLPKRCLYDPGFRLRCGAVHVVPFTIPRQLMNEDMCSGELVEESDLRALMPDMPATAHKGQRGVVAVFAGSTGTTGAAVLASQAALAAGAGLVTVVAAPEIHGHLASRLTSVMVRPEESGCDSLLRDPERFNAAVVGPGWGTSGERAQTLPKVTGSFSVGVLDADALTLLAGLADPPPLDGWVLTPHPGELARLTGASKDAVLADFFGAAVDAARRYGAVVAAKASTTVIARPDGRICVVDGLNPALATAGSGDVLSGVIGALLARGATAWDAARGGAMAHRIAGRRLRDRTGMFRSSALPNEIGAVIGGCLFGG